MDLGGESGTYGWGASRERSFIAPRELCSLWPLLVIFHYNNIFSNSKLFKFKMEELSHFFPASTDTSPLDAPFKQISQAFESLKSQSTYEITQLQATLESKEAEIAKYKMEMASLELELRAEKENSHRVMVELDTVKNEMAKY